MYITVKNKFIISIILTLANLALLLYIAIPWIQSLSSEFGLIMSIIIICGIAIGPGLLNFFLIISTILDKQKDIQIFDKPNEDVSILVAAYNEEELIYETLKSVSQQEYGGKIYLFALDNNSKDNTKLEIMRGIKDFSRDDLIIEYIFEPKQGKFHALNTGLKLVKTNKVITLDADSWVYKDAISNLVARMENEECVSVAGATMVRNSRDNLLTKMQEWDYFLSIAAVKKMQGLFQGTLVAQGAFSIYDTKLIKEYGGWYDCIGEDIVITWKMLYEGHKVYYEPKAIVFTSVPIKLKVLFNQRVRWARGMIEGFRRFKPWNFYKNKYVIFLTFIDIAIVYFDFAFVFFLIPGIIACFFGYTQIVGIITLFTIPLNFISFSILLWKERKYVFKPMGLKIRRNIKGYVAFLLTYQMIMSPAALLGYFKELTRSKRKWK
ncbi:MAG: glycosyltransferase family 2 protein [archaeon]|nr:glycosyltransferase family 2 protein [archaeon]